MSLLSPGRNIVLIGLMGTGKSTVGRALAARLGRPFVDTDRRIEQAAKTTIAEIFETDGERGFRRLEAAAVRDVSTLRGQVVAVGGGAVLDPANVTHLKATGDLVLLDADPATLAYRTSRRGRPLLDQAEDREAKLAELRSARAAAYASAAAHVIDTTGQAPQQIVDAILLWAARQPGLLSSDEPVR